MRVKRRSSKENGELSRRIEWLGLTISRSGAPHPSERGQDGGRERGQASPAKAKNDDMKKRRDRKDKIGEDSGDDQGNLHSPDTGAEHPRTAQRKNRPAWSDEEVKESVIKEGKPKRVSDEDDGKLSINQWRYARSLSFRWRDRRWKK
jgi:hypothetical protein